jgi:hypothetical protein
MENTNNYAVSVAAHGIPFITVGDFIFIGDHTHLRSGWTLILSVLPSDMDDLIDHVLLPLVERGMLLKLIKDEECHYKMNCGGVPHQMIGRTLTIFTRSVAEARELIPILNRATRDYHAIDIPFAIRLGKALFVNYLVVTKDENGEEDYRYEVPARIPFKVPAGYVRKEPKIFGHWYIPREVIRHSFKGSIYRGVSLNYMLFKPCLIKQGKENAVTDKYGRDIKQRFEWERNVQEALNDAVLTPAVYDLFDENGDVFYITEFIKGENFQDMINRVKGDVPWKELPTDDKIVLLGYFREMIGIIIKVHKAGYIHRDLTPQNFIIDRKKNIYLVDFELSYNWVLEIPEHPFLFGTLGFFAPEQLELKRPAIEEDIFSMTAILHMFLVGPVLLNYSAYRTVEYWQDVLESTGYTALITLLREGLSQDPDLRPTLQTMYKYVVNEISLLISRS